PIDAKSDISMNHIMFGEIGAWLYKAPGGIKPDEKQPGFKHILLQPHVVEGLDYFEASHDGPYGKIKSAWKRVSGGVRYEITIPANSSASINLELVRDINTTLNGKNISAGLITLPAGSHVIERKEE
ncbi:MAG: alpha-rhamnosidase, partial [Pedobacter sp.]